MKAKRGLTLLEALFLVAFVAAAGVSIALILLETARGREISRRTRCRNNLHELCKGMVAFRVSDAEIAFDNVTITANDDLP